eukprot:11605957-Alexandrium_andersonii.AAC.1
MPHSQVMRNIATSVQGPRREYGDEGKDEDEEEEEIRSHRQRNMGTKGKTRTRTRTRRRTRSGVTGPGYAH